MRFRRTVATGSVALFLLAFASAAASAQPEQAATLSISNPWTRATPPKAAAAGGFVTIENSGEAPDRLVGAASPIAGRAEIHEMRMDNGTMIMRPAEGGIEIPAGGTATLAPGGLHIMFMELKESLVEGDTVPVVLNFETAGDVEVSFSVEAIGARGPGGHEHGSQTPAADMESSDGQMNMQEGPHMHGHGQ